MDTTKWKPVKGLEDILHVTAKGEFKNIVSGKEITPFISKDRVYICASAHTKKYRFPAHRLIAETFVPNPEKKKRIRFKDNNKTNIKASNLEWTNEPVIHKLTNFTLTFTIRQYERKKQWDLYIRHNNRSFCWNSFDSQQAATAHLNALLENIKAFNKNPV